MRSLTGRDGLGAAAARKSARARSARASRGSARAGSARRAGHVPERRARTPGCRANGSTSSRRCARRSSGCATSTSELSTRFRRRSAQARRHCGQRNHTLLEENRRLREENAALKAELAIALRSKSAAASADRSRRAAGRERLANDRRAARFTGRRASSCCAPSRTRRPTRWRCCSQFLVAFGCACGRGAHYQVEADRHYTNEFVVLVGPTARGRKGSSWGPSADCSKTQSPRLRAAWWAACRAERV